MSIPISQTSVGARRAELLAELFFQELNPAFVSRPTMRNVDYDLLIGFPNDKAGINSFVVEIKPTSSPVKSHFGISWAVFNRLAHSNVPALLLVADVKRSQLYFAWLRPNGAVRAGKNVLIPVIRINETTKMELKKQLRKGFGEVAAAG